MSCFVRRTAVPLLLALAAQVAPLAAQEMWLGSQRPGFAVEILRPDVRTNAFRQSLASFAVFVTGRLRVGSGYHAVLELPVAFGSFSETVTAYAVGGPSGVPYTSTLSTSAIGNPYLGFEGGAGGAPAFGEFGIRLPVVSDRGYPATLVGALADFDRQEAFLTPVVTFSAFGNYRVAASGGLRFRLRAGPLVVFGTGSDGGMDVWAAYGIQAGYESGGLRVLAGVGGRALVTHATSRPFTDQLVTAVSFRTGPVRPGLSLRLPLDNGRGRMVGATIGVSLGMELP